ncbi:MAG: hypothetical protein GWO11_03770 [Desulfuromonadales bacterium]|nr:hypothetical protein [Desulfuromonadales bacterium]NIR33558.1 hypothetical protein [Desulfuromonadales bacterium]NIS41148.1 hypothetical protein [Desulfuromonadales bacterium]
MALAFIKRHGGSLVKGYEWNGKVLRPFGGSSERGWEFDGKIIRPWQGSRERGYEWDGKILKPYGRSSYSGYECRPGSMRSFSGKGRGWEKRAKSWAPRDQSVDRGWDVEGDIPLPVLALVLFDLVERAPQ